MKIRQIVGKASVSELVRHRLERATYVSGDTAALALRHAFPNHVVQSDAGRIAVQVRDKSFSVAVFEKIL